MSTQEFIDKQKKIFQEIIQKDIPLQRAAQSTAAKQATRIFVEGKNSAGGDIGKYNSSNPLYVNPSKSAGAATGNRKANVTGLGRPRGKTGQTTFKNGKPHKTVFLVSYKDFKGKIGQPNDKWRLVLSGDLRSDFSNGTKAVPIKENNHEYVVGLKRKENILKMHGLEERAGDIFPPTKQEERNFFDVATKEFNLIVANA